MDKLPRITFEDVLNSQTIIRNTITQLIKENRTVKTTDRDQFIQIYYRATLGKGGTTYLNTDIPGLRGMTLDKLVTVYLVKSNFSGLRCGYRGSVKHDLIKINQLWRIVLDHLNTSVFGAALQQAIVLSPEKDTGRDFGGRGSSTSQ